MQWAVWRSAAEPYFKVLEQSLLQFAGSLASAEAGRLDTLRVAMQACITVFRLQQAPHAWAATARKAMAKLAGQPVQADQPVPSPVLLEGLGKLYVLLDALETDETAAWPPVVPDPVQKRDIQHGENSV
jgi:flagellar biosynthesis protein FlhF